MIQIYASRFTNVFFFYGPFNVQKAGEVLMAKFPCTFCFHSREHVTSLFILLIAEIKLIKVQLLCIFPSISQILTYFCQLLILKLCRLYNVFGLGANHTIYTQLWCSQLQQTKVNQSMSSEVLVLGLHFSFLQWCGSFLQIPLKANIHQQVFQDLTHECQWKSCSERHQRWQVLEVHLYSSLCCVPCAQGSLLLRLT